MASLALIIPVAKGRIFVRSTCASTLRSAKSLIAHPAARINTVPSTIGIRMLIGGMPSAAIHSAHMVGQNTNSVPTGLSKRHK